MSAKITVVICTYNPQRDYLQRVLQSLKSQSLPASEWELLLIDNASEKILSEEVDLTWHPQSRHIREDKLGLTHARLRGIKEAAAEILVFVDDDNILDSEYLEIALRISKDCPFIGTWGGQICPEFETEPEEWLRPYLWMLAIRELKVDRWSNVPYDYESAPCGAGLCIRRAVAEKYAELLLLDPLRQNLGRKGQSLISSEDVDLAFTACDIGFGTGVFTLLKLTHIIPPKRLQKDYVLKLAEANGYSTVIVESLRGKFPTPKSQLGKLYEIYRTFKMSSFDRHFSQAWKRGHSRALQEIDNLKK